MSPFRNLEWSEASLRIRNLASSIARGTIRSGLAVAATVAGEEAFGQGTRPPVTAYSMYADNIQPVLPKDWPRFADPVILSTGNFRMEETDLSIPGRGMDFTFTRTYRSGTNLSSTLGQRWDFNWNQFIALQYDVGPGGGGGGGNSPETDDPEPLIQGAFYHNGGTRIDWFTPTGGLMWNSPPGYFAKLRHTGGLPLPAVTPESFILRTADGTILTFGVLDPATDPFVYALVYRLSQVEDRMGNKIQIFYELVQAQTTYHRIDFIRDTFGRDIHFNYHTTTHLLTSITDFASRTVTFGHDSFNNLTDVTSPVVTGTVTNNNFLNGRTAHYDYNTGSSEPYERHNLTAVYGAKEWSQIPGQRTPYLTNTYEQAGPRVVQQYLGGDGVSGVPSGGRYCFLYRNQGEYHGWFLEASRTLVIDPNGNTALHLFDLEGNERLRYRFTGRLDPDNPPSQSGTWPIVVNPASPNPQSDRLSGLPKLRSTDPKSYIVRRDYSPDGLLLEEQGEGRRTLYTYGSSADDPFQRGNLLREIRMPYPSDPNVAPITTLYAYEPVFNQVRGIIDPRGNDSSFVPPDGGATSPSRYRTLHYFDYQEYASFASSPAALQSLLTTWDIDLDQDDQVAVFGALPLWMGEDMNGGGATQSRGNLIKTKRPAATTLDDPLTTGSFTSQECITTTVFNSLSLPTSVTDPELNVTTLAYYQSEFPSLDPTGQSYPAVSSGGGFLGYITEPEGVTRQLSYDTLGRTTGQVDGRGLETDITYNALDEVIQVEVSDVLDAIPFKQWFIYDHDGSLIEDRIQNKTPTIEANGLPNGQWQYGASGEWITNRYEYDLLNQHITEDLQAGASARLVTKFRYDRVGNRVLTLFPQWIPDTGPRVPNWEARVFDERNLPWQTTRGGRTPEFSSLPANANAQQTIASVSDSGLESTITIDYDEGGRATKTVDGQGNARFVTYDAFERPVTTRDPLGNWSKTHYDPADNVVRKQHFGPPFGGANLLAESFHRHDEQNRVYQTDEALFSTDQNITLAPVSGTLTPTDNLVTTRTKFDKNGRVVLAVNDNKSTVTYLYDDRGRVSVATDILGNSTTYSYDNGDNPIKVVELEWDSTHSVPTTFISRLFYDKCGRLKASVNSAGHAVRRLFDTRGNLVFESDALGPVTASPIDLDTYSEHQGLSGSINAHGNTTTWAYDDASRSTSRTRFMRLDGQGGQPVQGTIQTATTYNRNSLVTSQTDNASNPTTYTYDVLDRLEKTKWADTTEETLTYRPDNNVQVRTDPNNITTTHSYDSAGRVISKAVSGSGLLGTTLETFTYDGLHRIVTAADNDSTVSRVYDSLSRVIRETTQDGKATTSVYDGVGNLKTLTYPGGRTVQFTYDTRDRLKELKDVGAGFNIAEYRYIGPGRLEYRDYPASTIRLNALYDDARRITSMDHALGGTHKDWREFVWDRVGNRTRRTEHLACSGSSHSDRVHDYAYDSQYRLVESERTSPGSSLQQVAYALDGMGNRISVTGGPDAGSYGMSGAIPPADAQMNQYTTTPFHTRAYDSSGNLKTINANDVTLSFDFRNQMVRYKDRVPDPDLTHNYAYDALGRRISKLVDILPPGGDVTTRFYYYGWQVIEERNALDQVTATFVYGNGLDEVLTMRNELTGAVYYYHADDLGSVMKISNPQGVVQESYEYGDYGRLLNGATLAGITGSAIGNPFFFAGARYDSETGLYYMRARHMDPKSGRFIGRDPLGTWGDPTSIGNGATYAGNNPWTLVDRLGLRVDEGFPGCGGGGCPGGGLDTDTPPCGPPIPGDGPVDPSWGYNPFKDAKWADRSAWSIVNSNKGPICGGAGGPGGVDSAMMSLSVPPLDSKSEDSGAAPPERSPDCWPDGTPISETDVEAAEPTLEPQRAPIRVVFRNSPRVLFPQRPSPVIPPGTRVVGWTRSGGMTALPGTRPPPRPPRDPNTRSRKTREDVWEDWNRVPGSAKLPKEWIEPTNAAQNPPDKLPPGYELWVGKPKPGYPDGYWRVFNAQKQPIDISTGLPPGNVSRAQARAMTHVRFPPK